MSALPPPTLTWLEMTSPDLLRPSPSTVAVDLVPATGERVRELTLAVGAPHRWPSQRWTELQWTAYLGRADIRHWAARADGVDVGILSIDLSAAPVVEVDSLGLLPAYVGRGLGGPLLTESVRLAWAQSPPPTTLVRLHTTDADHPHALANYLARGFTRCDPWR